MSAARTERLLNLLTLLLNSTRPVSLRELRDMEEFAAYCTADPKSGERAFERDKAALLESGVPLQWVAPEQGEEEDGGYIIDRQAYYLPPLRLEPQELALLSIAGAAALAIEGFPSRRAAVRALAKLGFDVEDEETKSAPLLAHAPLRTLDPERVGRWLEDLHDAVARRIRVRLVYGGLGKAPTERAVDPYGLYYRQGAWYLVGYCHLRASERTFHLGRISSLRLDGRKGADYEVPEGFDIHAHAQRRPWEFPLEHPFLVRVQVAPRLVPAIAEIFGSKAQVSRAADATKVQFWASHREALVGLMLPYGDATRVLEPAWLRDHLAETFTALCARYEEGRAA